MRPRQHTSADSRSRRLALAGLLGACTGGGSEDSGASTSSDEELSAAEKAELKTESEFAQCMRDRGIDRFPDPQVNDDGFKVVGAPWEQDTDEWNEAQQSCQHVFDEAAAPGETAAGWEKVVPGGDCHCADGGEFAFWERRADPTKVVFFLDGGGACYDATTCAFLPEDPAYDWNVRGDDPSQDGGSSTWAGPTTPSATTASCLSRPAPVTCTSAAPPASTRPS